MKKTKYFVCEILCFNVKSYTLQNHRKYIRLIITINIIRLYYANKKKSLHITWTTSSNSNIGYFMNNSIYKFSVIFFKF